MADHPYLSHNQQDLLLAALSSQARPNSRVQAISASAGIPTDAPSAAVASADMADQTDSKQTFLSPEGLDTFDVDFTPELDFLDGDQSFDFENADLGGEMIGGLPGEKRKSPAEGGVTNGDSKRQELQEGERSAKKPGRKPLTSEPTTKRKAQNRAAQRAFRERKEKHVKDLETKVAELEKASEADKHENGLLKAQIEKQQAELKEYRKRLSQSKVNTTSPILSGHVRNNSTTENNFNFDFPQFGALPAVHFPNRDSASPRTNQPPATAVRHSASPTEKRQSQDAYSPHARAQAAERTDSLRSTGSYSSRASNSHSTTLRSIAEKQVVPDQPSSNYGFSLFSTPDNMHGFASTLPTMASNDLGDLFSPSILQSANIDGYFGNATVPQPQPKNRDLDTGGESTAGLDRVFQFNGGSNASDSTSPSASSTSQWNGHGISSSCGTSPEPSYDSPATKDKLLDAEFASSRKNSSMIPPQNTNSVQQSSNLGLGTAFDFTNIDYSATTLDPVLFGDYRDQAQNDFGSNFFDDALNSANLDYGSPSNLFGILQSPQPSNAEMKPTTNTTNEAMTPSRALMAECEKARDGGDDDYGLPSYKSKQFDDPSKFISCNSIWNQLQSCPDFQEGKFDLDSLCAELRTKATCSESGLMVEKDHVDRALRRLGSKDDTGKLNTGSAGLMFEASSWGNVLQKMSNNKQ